MVDIFGGSISAWERSKVQGGTLVGDQINISNSAGVQLSTRTSGTVHQSATTQVSSAPDLTDLCMRIRELVPSLNLEEQDQQELLDQVERLEGAAGKPEVQAKGVKRWLSNIKDLLTSDSTGKALGVLAKVGAAIQYFTKSFEENPSTA